MTHPLVPAHAVAATGQALPSASLPVVVGLAGVGAVLLAGLGVAALWRRRSPAYLLVALALGMLLVRTFIAGATLSGLLGDASHHLLEHGVDVAMAALVLAAVYYARRVERVRGEGA